MSKSKAKLIAMTFIIFVISIFFINSNFATQINNEEVTDWKVSITGDTKDLKDTQEISFKAQDNSNVEGRIAPGVKAVATIEVNLVETKYPVEVTLTADDSNLYNSFKLTSKLNDEDYILGTTKIFELPKEGSFTEENGNKIFKLELEWQNSDNNEIDTALGLEGGTISIPVSVNVKQHI